jgi:hypothetical protein
MVIRRGHMKRFGRWCDGAFGGRWGWVADGPMCRIATEVFDFIGKIQMSLPRRRKFMRQPQCPLTDSRQLCVSWEARTHGESHLYAGVRLFVVRLVPQSGEYAE